MNILPNCLNLILADIINDKYNVEEEDQFEFMSVIGISISIISQKTYKTL
jgi:hypothetical protein